MGKWVYHHDGSAGSGLHPWILCMGEIPFPSPIPSLEILEGTDDHWFLSSLLRYVYLVLVSFLLRRP